MSTARILLCLDTDAQSSVFDSVVAIDCDVDHVLRHCDVEPAQVRDLVHGAMFTRGPAALHNTALFVGGSDVHRAEKLLDAVEESFFGNVRVSVMLDPSGANTTAAAAVVTAGRHLPFGPEMTATVLAATGPVGQRVVRLLATEEVEVRVASRSMKRAEGVCHRVSSTIAGARLTPHSTESTEMATLLEGSQLVIAAGSAGVELLGEPARRAAASVKVAIDLNAVPPVGIGGVLQQDKAANHDGQICYGALGVGGMKMKIHKRAIARLFDRNDLVLDAEEIYALGKGLAAGG